MSNIDFVTDDLINNIIQNVYQKDNYKLPTEREMAEMYNVSRYTIRKAVEKLENIGYVYKVQGSGIFVGDAIHNNTFMYNSMTQNKFNEIRSEIIYFKETPINPELSQKCNVPPTAFWEFKRVRIIDSQKLQVEITTLPKILFPDFNIEIAKTSIHNYVSSLGFEISHLHTEYSAVNLSAEDALLLESKRGVAATKIINRGYLKNNIVFEFSESLNLNYSCSYINDYNWNIHKLRKE